MHSWFSFHRLFNVILNRPEKKNDMTMSVCAEKPCEKLQHSFMIKKKKNLQKNGNRSEFPQLDKEFPQKTFSYQLYLMVKD